MRLSRLLGLLGLTLGSLSCYSPDFDNDLLQCGPMNNCPKGYTCASDLRCWKNGDVVPATTGDSTALFVGTWTFNSGNINSACSDGPPLSSPISGDTVPVTANGSNLVASYFCDWTMQLNPGTSTAMASPPQGCTEMIKDDKTGATYTYQWMLKAFSFTTTDGKTASVSGDVGGPFTGTDGSKGTCDGTFTGTLAKTGP